jgi:hypothetical protein
MRQQHYQGYTAGTACMRVVGRQMDTLIPLDSFALRCRASVYAPAPPLAQSSDGSAFRNHGSRCFTCKRKHKFHFVEQILWSFLHKRCLCVLNLMPELPPGMKK